MVSSTLMKLSSPVARSCLIALSVALLIDAILTIYAASQYPYLIDHYNDDLYITSARTITIAYSGIALVAILVSISTAIACYKNATNYALIHGGITGVFLPVTILIYFSTISSRYKVSDYVVDYHDMIADYRISGGRRKREQQQQQQQSNEDPNRKVAPILESVVSMSGPKPTLSSFINVIDSLQTKFSCCGVDSSQDWMKQWDQYIPPSCCQERSVSTNNKWANLFHVEETHEFKFCNESNSYHVGCLVALKEDEHSKYAWLSDLIVFMIVITIANTIGSLLLFGLTKTEDSSHDGSYEDHELSIVGVSSKPRPSQPTIMSIKHRPSVVQTLGASTENISARAQAVRFNISNTPRGSVSGPSKFSAGARRGSSFI